MGGTERWGFALGRGEGEGLVWGFSSLYCWKGGEVMGRIEDRAYAEQVETF